MIVLFQFWSIKGGFEQVLLDDAYIPHVDMFIYNVLKNFTHGNNITSRDSPHSNMLIPNASVV